MNGVLLFTGGLALIRSHNNWTVDWTILITEQTHIGTLLAAHSRATPKQAKEPRFFIGSRFNAVEWLFYEHFN